MEESSIYTECELRFTRDEGYDLSQAAEICANAAGRFSHEEPGKQSEDEGWEEYWGDK